MSLFAYNILYVKICAFLIWEDVWSGKSAGNIIYEKV